jgi:hypothetical protein
MLVLLRDFSSFLFSIQSWCVKSKHSILNFYCCFNLKCNDANVLSFVCLILKIFYWKIKWLEGPFKPTLIYRSCVLRAPGRSGCNLCFYNNSWWERVRSCNIENYCDWAVGHVGSTIQPFQDIEMNPNLFLRHFFHFYCSRKGGKLSFWKHFLISSNHFSLRRDVYSFI